MVSATVTVTTVLSSALTGLATVAHVHTVVGTQLQSSTLYSSECRGSCGSPTPVAGQSKLQNGVQGLLRV